MSPKELSLSTKCADYNEGGKQLAEPNKPPSSRSEVKIWLCRLQTPGHWFLASIDQIVVDRFRARHECLSLRAGELVVFQMAERRGRALAIWTHIAKDCVETGFRIAEDDG
jgi:hypothetical protein